MPFSGHGYDPQTLATLIQAFNAAWSEFQALTVGYSDRDLITARKMMALEIMVAANNGERDPERLKAIALSAVSVG